MASELFDTVKEIISVQLHISEDDISEDSLILEELGANSLDAVEMLMSLEDATGISVPDEDAETLRTPGDIVRYLENRSH